MVRFLLASIHDVSPRFEAEVEALVDLLQPHAGNRIAMLVVPNHWGDAPLLPCSSFAARLRSWAEQGFEMFLHGYFHRDDLLHERMSDKWKARFMTAREGEFLGLSAADAADRIEGGRALIEDITGKPIAGFVAPAWLYGQGARQAIMDCAMPLAEDHLRVWSPATGHTLARGPVLTWASRSRPRLISSLAAAAVLRRAPVDVLRIGVHPPDCHNRSIVRSIEHSLTVAMRSRVAARYSDLAEKTPRTAAGS
jgi:predicted deacetylase